MLKLIFTSVLLFTSITFAQSSKDTLWQPLKFFIGEWKGQGEGESGKGDYERSYNFIFDKQFIEVKNKSSYPPSEANNNKGEVHQDLGFISFDRLRKNFILRQFHIEGFVNQYVSTNISSDGKKIVFTSEEIENIPKGWRARETYDILNENEFSETFELAAPDKDFEVYSKVTLKRIK